MKPKFPFLIKDEKLGIKLIPKASKYSRAPKNKAMMKPNVCKYLDVRPVFINV